MGSLRLLVVCALTVPWMAVTQAAAQEGAEDAPPPAPKSAPPEAKGKSSDRPKSTEINRCQVFVVGMSEDLSHQAAGIANQFRKVMKETSGIQLLDLADMLKAPAPAKVREAQTQAQADLQAADKALRDLEHSLAIEKARSAKEAFEKMGGYLEPMARYQEALLILAAAHAMQGDVAKANKAFLDLLILDPHMNMPKNRYEGFVLELFNRTKEGLASQPRGSLSLKTSPPGGNLYLDGRLAGVTPESIDGLIAGSHLVVVKLAGYENWGTVARVEPGELIAQDIKLVPGKAGSGFVATSDRACRAVSDSDLRGEVLRLGQTVGLDWAILGQLKHDEYDVVLHLYLFEFSRARVIYDDKLTMENSDYGLEEEVRRFGRDFMSKGLRALKEFREQGDPLSGRSGTEDWYRDESAKSVKHRESQAEEVDRRKDPKSESGDPLDDKDGTEDW